VEQTNIKVYPDAVKDTVAGHNGAVILTTASNIVARTQLAAKYKGSLIALLLNWRNLAHPWNMIRKKALDMRRVPGHGGNDIY